MSKNNIYTYTKRFDQENRIALIFMDSQPLWKGIVQSTLEKIVRQTFQLRVEERTAGKILRIIGCEWCNISKEVFPNLITYYTVLAKMTDYLLLVLTEECNQIEYALSHKNIIYGLDTDKTVLQFYYSIKEDDIQTYFCKALDHLPKMLQAPKQVQIICIESGIKYCYFPDAKEFQKEEVNSFNNL